MSLDERGNEGDSKVKKRERKGEQTKRERKRRISS